MVRPVLQLTLLRSTQDSPPGRQVLGYKRVRGRRQAAEGAWLSCGGKEGPGEGFLVVPHGAGLLGRRSPGGAHSLTGPPGAAWLATGHCEPTPLHRPALSILCFVFQQPLCPLFSDSFLFFFSFPSSCCLTSCVLQVSQGESVGGCQPQAWAACHTPTQCPTRPLFQLVNWLLILAFYFGKC